jgi:hypothetical protein
MSARSIEAGKVVMSDLASIAAQMADVKAEQADLTERRAELEDKERELWARWTMIFVGEAGAENPVDLRTKQRRRRQIVPRKTVPVTEHDHALAAQSLAMNENKRRQG